MRSAERAIDAEQWQQHSAGISRVSFFQVEVPRGDAHWLMGANNDFVIRRIPRAEVYHVAPVRLRSELAVLSSTSNGAPRCYVRGMLVGDREKARETLCRMVLTSKTLTPQSCNSCPITKSRPSAQRMPVADGSPSQLANRSEQFGAGA